MQQGSGKVEQMYRTKARIKSRPQLAPLAAITNVEDDDQGQISKSYRSKVMMQHHVVKVVASWALWLATLSTIIVDDIAMVVWVEL